MAEIYGGLRDGGVDAVAVVGDLNDTPASESLAPLLQETDLRDISTHAAFDFGPRRGTFRGNNEPGKLDYVLLSPSLWERGDGRRRVPQRRLARPTHGGPVGALSHADRRGARGQRPRR